MAGQAGRALDGVAVVRARRADAAGAGLARARYDLVEDRTRVKQRVEKLLEDALIKISSVLTDMLGVSGRAMMEALIAGQRSPKVLAELARGRARARRADLERALDGRFTDHHARLARMLLDQLDDLTARITEVTGCSTPRSAPCQRRPLRPGPPAPTSSIRPGPTGARRLHLGGRAAVCRPRRRPGLRPRGHRRDRAGHDRVRHPGRLCSWARVPPRTVQSGRKNGRASTGKGNPYLKSALAQIATGAAKTDTFLGERYRRLIKRMPKAKALVALQRSILVIFFHLLADPTAEFTDLGPDFYPRRLDRARRTNHLLRQLQALGYNVQLTETA